MTFTKLELDTIIFEVQVEVAELVRELDEEQDDGTEER